MVADRGRRWAGWASCDAWRDRRRMSAPALSKHLRGDLDWIVFKAMAKEPERRYESATGLAMDLERFLEHQGAKEESLAGKENMGGGGRDIKLLTVGSLAPNPFGLFDVGGNLWEWCLDPYYGRHGAERPGDGLRPEIGSSSPRVIRGGDFGNGASLARSGYRDVWLAPTDRDGNLGVRPARTSRL